jgi:phosphomannomutase
MTRLRERPPTEVAGRPVTSVVDHIHRSDPAPADVIELELELDGGRVVARPSGTEPKLKVYFHTVVGVDAAATDLHGARAEAETVLDRLQDAMGRFLGLS